jgi:hypothetical protein
MEESTENYLNEMNRVTELSKYLKDFQISMRGISGIYTRPCGNTCSFYL